MIEITWRGTDRVRYRSQTDGLLIHYIESAIRDLQTFAECDLAGYNFAGGDFRYGRFDAANLQGTVFAGADLRGASFRDADLREAIFDGALTEGADFTGAVLEPHQRGRGPADAAIQQMGGVR